MDLTQQKDKLLTYFSSLRSNKYNLFFLGAITLMLIMITTMIVLVAHQSHSSPPKIPASITTAPSSEVTNESSSSPIQITTPDPTQAALIDTQTQPQITPNVAIPYTVSAINQFGSEWAVMTITNPRADPAQVIVKKESGTWQVILGPGTQFDTQALQQVGAPQELIDSLNASQEVQTSPSPSTTQSNN